MTRPIYEPSPSRKDSYLEFQSDQLFRRPAPSLGIGEWAYLWRTADFTMTTGVSYNPFTASTTAAESDATVLDANATDGVIYINAPGIFVAFSCMDFTTSFSGTKLNRHEWSVTQVAPGGAGQYDMQIGETAGNIFNTSMVFVQTVVAGDYIRALFQQASGSDKTFNSGALRVVRIAPFP